MDVKKARVFVIVGAAILALAVIAAAVAFGAGYPPLGWLLIALAISYFIPVALLMEQSRRRKRIGQSDRDTTRHGPDGNAIR
ncbi:hypothetical protein [Diaminobutyricibacter sp. McL0608]|uniref:hypothetical protein n=1 Tax=Leifsonia sp. McL0608 TaxID=3143537 RepID=UPI0031F2E64F